jgi:hypothetical protein
VTELHFLISQLTDEERETAILVARRLLRCRLELLRVLDAAVLKAEARSAS